MNEKYCRLCGFRSSDRSTWNRHVAIEHGDGLFSPIHCGECEKNYYDGDHYSSHLTDGSICGRSNKVTGEPLTERMQVAFQSLVDQMMVTPIERDDRSSGASVENTSVSTTVAQREDVPVIEISDSEDEPPRHEQTEVCQPSNVTQHHGDTATIQKRVRVVIINEQTVPILKYDCSRDPIENDESPVVEHLEDQRTEDAEMDRTITAPESDRKKTTVDGTFQSLVDQMMNPPDVPSDRTSSVPCAQTEQSQSTEGQATNSSDPCNDCSIENTSMAAAVPHRQDVSVAQSSDFEGDTIDEPIAPNAVGRCESDANHQGGTATIPKPSTTTVIDELDQRDYFLLDPTEESNETFVESSENGDTEDAEVPDAATALDMDRKKSMNEQLIAIARRNLVDNQLRCNICDRHTNLERLAPSVIRNCVLLHALTHAEFKTIACKRCDYECSRVDVIRLHLKTRHRHPNIRTDYTDSSEARADEIVGIFARCYEQVHDDRELLTPEPEMINDRPDKCRIIPESIEFCNVRVDFGLTCKRREDCYRMCDRTQRECDSEFGELLLRLCSEKFSGGEDIEKDANRCYIRCAKTALIFQVSVRNFAKDHYREARRLANCPGLEATTNRAG